MKRRALKRTADKKLVEQSESHVIVLFLLRFFFLLLFLLGCGSITTSCCSRSSSSSSRSSADTRSYVGDQGFQVTGLQGLGEEAGPVRLDINTSGLENGGDLLRSHGNVIISKDESGVHTGKFRVRHDDLGCTSFLGRT